MFYLRRASRATRAWDSFMLKVSPRPALGAVPAPLFLWARPIEAHNPQKTQITTKKARKLLYDTIICTTFGPSDPSKSDVNRIAVVVNVENLQPDSIRGCPTSDR